MKCDVVPVAVVADGLDLYGKALVKGCCGWKRGRQTSIFLRPILPAEVNRALAGAVLDDCNQLRDESGSSDCWVEVRSRQRRQGGQKICARKANLSRCAGSTR